MSAGNVLPGFSTKSLLKKTLPERMRFLAWERDSQSFCWTRSSSTRSLLLFESFNKEVTYDLDYLDQYDED